MLSIFVHTTKLISKSRVSIANPSPSRSLLPPRVTTACQYNEE
jgi:hypothetical protein